MVVLVDAHVVHVDVGVSVIGGRSLQEQKSVLTHFYGYFTIFWRENSSGYVLSLGMWSQRFALVTSRQLSLRRGVLTSKYWMSHRSRSGGATSPFEAESRKKMLQNLIACLKVVKILILFSKFGHLCRYQNFPCV